MLTSAALRGAAAGAVGVTAMTLGEKLEQRVTGRPSSYVPGRTFLALLRHRQPETAQPFLANQSIHWGQGLLLGAVRGLWSEVGMRGPVWTGVHTVVRLALDQTLENTSRVGAPPRSWPRQELTVDVLHKGVYSTVTGWLSDRWVAEQPRPLPGRLSH